MEDITEKELLECIDDLSLEIAANKVSELSQAVAAYKSSFKTVNEVEFWKWMNANYKKGGMFSSSKNLQEFIQSSKGRADWVSRQIQGKGYEWDWMIKEQGKVKNIFSQFSAGTDPTQVGVDVIKKNIFNGEVKSQYQHKSYISSTKVNSQALKNTPKDAIVVSQKENISDIQRSGYKTEAFESKLTSKKKVNKKFQEAQKGHIETNYNISNVGSVMLKAGVMGAAIGLTLETVLSYKRYKRGEITKKEYLKEIFKTSGNTGVTSGITAGAMMVVESIAIGAGVTVAVPVLFVVSYGIGKMVDKVVAPIFCRGKYKEYVEKMKFYKDIGEAYNEFARECEYSMMHFNEYIQALQKQNQVYDQIKKYDNKLNAELLDTLSRI